jgi:hypothetical protein
MQLLLQNPYGLDPSNQYHKLDYITHSLATYNVDITCLPKASIDWKKPTILKPRHALLRKHYKHHRLIPLASSTTVNHAYLAGDTACITTNK